MRDDRVCQVCQALDGYTWTFEVGYGDMTGVLNHPMYGLVWTIGIGSGAHGHGGGCRCHLTATYEIGDLIERAQQLKDKLQMAYDNMQAAEEGK